MKKDNLIDFSMFLLRLIASGIFITHGCQKLFGMFDGLGLEGVMRMIESLGMSYSYAISLVWALAEFIGGILLVLGILTRFASGAILATVLFHMWKVDLNYGFFVQSADIEYELLVIGVMMCLIFMGGGRWSIWD